MCNLYYTCIITSHHLALISYLKEVVIGGQVESGGVMWNEYYSDNECFPKNISTLRLLMTIIHASPIVMLDTNSTNKTKHNLFPAPN